MAAHRPLPELRDQDRGQPSRANLLLWRAGELPVSDLARRQLSTGLTSWQSSRELLATRREGIVRTARVQAAAHVTRTALREAGLLSALEARLIHEAPLGEVRYQIIVDSFAQVAADEIVRMGWS